MSVCCDCCVLSGKGLCDELIARPEEPCQLWFVVVCDLKSGKMAMAHFESKSHRGETWIKKMRYDVNISRVQDFS